MIEPQLPNLEFNNQQMRDLIGKRVLVGITRRNMNDEVVSLEQFHGAIDRFSLDEGLVLKLTNGAERIIPPDLTRLETASPGEYRLKATGETAVDPDFTAMWTIYPKGYRGQPDV
ncbi:MAG TPA: hypothetical protein VK141_07940 [Nitrosomonas sp.]|nr:hypothetical protein [Nitrosomonas sp.]